MRVSTAQCTMVFRSLRYQQRDSQSREDDRHRSPLSEDSIFFPAEKFTHSGEVKKAGRKPWSLRILENSKENLPKKGRGRSPLKSGLTGGRSSRVEGNGNQCIHQNNDWAKISIPVTSSCSSLRAKISIPATSSCSSLPSRKTATFNSLLHCLVCSTSQLRRSRRRLFVRDFLLGSKISSSLYCTQSTSSQRRFPFTLEIELGLKITNS